MDKRGEKRARNKDFNKPKKAKITQKKEEKGTINFDVINELILKTHPNLDTKNLELIKFLTIFDIIYEQINKNDLIVEASDKTEELDSVDGVP